MVGCLFNCSTPCFFFSSAGIMAVCERRKEGMSKGFVVIVAGTNRFEAAMAGEETSKWLSRFKR